MMDSIIMLAQAGDVSEVNQWGIVLVGFSFVVLVLALLALVTTAMGSLFNKQSVRSAEKAVKVAATAAKITPVTPAEEATSEADSAVIAAVIAAAVHTVIGDRPHRVVSIRSTGPGWAQEGRRQIFSSHRVR